MKKLAMATQTDGIEPASNTIPTTSLWAHKYRGVRLISFDIAQYQTCEQYTDSDSYTGNSRRPRPTPRPLLQTHRLHLHRSNERLRTRLHPPNRHLRRYSLPPRLPQHPAPKTTPQRRQSQRFRLRGKSNAEVQKKGECL